MSRYDDVFAAFEAAGVRYVVVGGVAVVLRGHPRTTVDLDVVVDLEQSAALRAVEALLGLGLLPRIPVDPRGFAVEDVRRSWLEDKNLLVLSFFDPADIRREVDVFVFHPIDFEELVAAADRLPIGAHRVPTASLDHLLVMKRAAGRAQDLADIEVLETLSGDRS